LKPDPGPGRRIVVVSPHLDDGVLSLGAAMSSWARRSVRVELLTVLACDPSSDAPAGGWDARAGFATEGESARARREEDRLACAILGIAPVWLPFGSVDYERHGDEDEVRAAVENVVRGAGEVLVPGSPLTHPDHAWLVQVIGPVAAGAARVSRYAEQPYTRRDTGQPLGFERVRSSARDRLAKWRAIREYRSQLPLLGMRRSIRSAPLALALGRESVAWVPDPSGARH
jgi:LmbE family N-acetylglucosaminyl deacetylase